MKNLKVLLVLFLLILSGCMPKEDDPILYRIESENRNVGYIHKSGKITDIRGKVTGYIEDIE